MASLCGSGYQLSPEITVAKPPVDQEEWQAHDGDGSPRNRGPVLVLVPSPTLTPDFGLLINSELASCAELNLVWKIKEGIISFTSYLMQEKS